MVVQWPEAKQDSCAVQPDDTSESDACGNRAAAAHGPEQPDEQCKHRGKLQQHQRLIQPQPQPDDLVRSLYAKSEEGTILDITRERVANRILPAPRGGITKHVDHVHVRPGDREEGEAKSAGPTQRPRRRKPVRPRRRHEGIGIVLWRAVKLCFTADGVPCLRDSYSPLPPSIEH
jgi:hypothetical protein